MEQIRNEWDLMIRGWARAQTEAFTILDVMRKLFGPMWIAGSDMHRTISMALHRLPEDEFEFSAPVQNGICTPTWTPRDRRRYPSSAQGGA